MKADGPRILAITPGDFRSADSGGRLREFYLCRALAQLGKLDVLTFQPHQPTPGRVRDIDANVLIDKKPPRSAALLRSLATGRSYHQILFDARRHADFAAVRSRRYDLIHCSFSYSIPAAAELLDAGSSGATVVWDTHNYDPEVWAARAGTTSAVRKLFATRQLKPIEAITRRAVSTADLIVACTDGDRERIRLLDASVRVEVVPNGGETSHWAKTASELTPEPGRIVIFGGLAQDSTRRGIEWFLTEVWPGVQERKPTATLHVAGRGPSRSLAHAVESARSATLHTNPPDLATVVAAAETIAVPQVWGTGSKIKMFEALATGRRVIASPAATIGLTEDLLDEIDVAGDAGDWIAHLSNSAVASDQSVSARRKVAARHEWSAMGESFRRIIEQSLGDRSG